MIKLEKTTNSSRLIQLSSCRSVG